MGVLKTIKYKLKNSPKVEFENEDEESLTAEDLGDVYVEEEGINLDKEFDGEVKIKKEDTRGKFAIFFLIGFFLVVLIGIVIGSMAESENVKNMTQIILTISGILSGPLGFIVGYYFRRQEEENN